MPRGLEYRTFKYWKQSNTVQANNYNDLNTGLLQGSRYCNSLEYSADLNIEHVLYWNGQLLFGC